MCRDAGTRNPPRVVATSTRELAEPPAVRLTVAGEIMQVDRGGAPEQVWATAPAIPFELYVRLNVAVCPAVTVAEVEEALIEKSGVPAPLSTAVCGLPGASLTTLSAALLTPGEVGPNVTPMVQLALGASAAGQLLVCANSALFVPVMPTLVMLTVAVPMFVSVTFCVALVVPTFWLPKLTLVGLSVTGPTPVPKRPAVWRLPGALLGMLRVACREPTIEGEKAIWISQFVLEGNVLAEQVSLTLLKSLGSVPVMVTLPIARSKEPVLATVRVCGGLVVPTS